MTSECIFFFNLVVFILNIVSLFLILCESHTILYLTEMHTKCRVRAVDGGHFKCTACIQISGFKDLTHILLL